jgi:hypothetical protein
VGELLDKADWDEAFSQTREALRLSAQVFADIAPDVAKSYKALMDALLTEGFSRDEALKIITSGTVVKK